MSSQILVLTLRQIRLTVANRLNLSFFICLPILAGILLHVIPGSNGFLKSNSDNPTEAVRLLAFVLLGCCLMGLSLAMREIITNREVIAHEIYSGLKIYTLILSKVIVLSILAFIESAVLVIIVVLTYQFPENGLFIDARLELLFAAWLTTLANAMLALFISSLLTHNNQTMPSLAIIVLASIIMCGALVPVNRSIVNEMSLVFPTRWGFALAASSLDSNNSYFTPDSFTDKDLKEYTAMAKIDQENYDKAKEIADNGGGATNLLELHQKAVRSTDIAQKMLDASKLTVSSETDEMWDASKKQWFKNFFGCLAMIVIYGLCSFLAISIKFRKYHRRKVKSFV